MPVSRHAPVASPVVADDALALKAIAWMLADDDRAQRLLALSGITPDGLRAALADRSSLAAILTHIVAHEPDLLACAEAIEAPPAQIVAAGESLSR